MQVSIHDQSVFSHKHLSINIPIISKSNTYLETVPALRLSDFILPLPWYQIFVFTLPNPNQVKFNNKMEEVDECLLIASTEISSWKELLKQVVSQSLTLIISMQFDQFLLVTLANQILDLIKNVSIFRGLQRPFLYPCKLPQLCSRPIKEGQHKTHLSLQSLENKFYAEI